MKNRLIVWLALFAMLAAVGASRAQTPDLASALVRSTTDRMLTALQTRRADLDASPGLIYALVEEIVLPAFDFERITRYAMGRYWRTASAAQQQALVASFRQLLMRTYARALLNYAGQEIRLLPLRPGRRAGQVTVHTEVNEAGGPSVPIDYQLYLKGNTWKVFDITIDGISLVANYRSSFAAQIRRDGIDGLIQTIERRNTEGPS